MLSDIRNTFLSNSMLMFFCYASSSCLCLFLPFLLYLVFSSPSLRHYFCIILWIAPLFQHLRVSKLSSSYLILTSSIISPVANGVDAPQLGSSDLTSYSSRSPPSPPFKNWDKYNSHTVKFSGFQCIHWIVQLSPFHSRHFHHTQKTLCISTSRSHSPPSPP